MVNMCERSERVHVRRHGAQRAALTEGQSGAPHLRVCAETGTSQTAQEGRREGGRGGRTSAWKGGERAGVARTKMRGWDVRMG